MHIQTMELLKSIIILIPVFVLLLIIFVWLCHKLKRLHKELVEGSARNWKRTFGIILLRLLVIVLGIASFLCLFCEVYYLIILTVRIGAMF